MLARTCCWLIVAILAASSVVDVVLAYDRLTCDFDLSDANARVQLPDDCAAIRLGRPHLAELMLAEAQAFRRFTDALEQLERQMELEARQPAEMQWPTRRGLYEKHDLLLCRAQPTREQYLVCLTETRNAMTAEVAELMGP